MHTTLHSGMGLGRFMRQWPFGGDNVPMRACIQTFSTVTFYLLHSTSAFLILNSSFCILYSALFILHSSFRILHVDTYIMDCQYTIGPEPYHRIAPRHKHRSSRPRPLLPTASSTRSNCTPRSPLLHSVPEEEQLRRHKAHDPSGQRPPAPAHPPPALPPLCAHQRQSRTPASTGTRTPQHPSPPQSSPVQPQTPRHPPVSPPHLQP